MGRIRDEIYDTMWDSWTCKKHGTTMPDSRFRCDHCTQERETQKKIDGEKMKKLLEENGLSHVTYMLL